MIFSSCQLAILAAVVVLPGPLDDPRTRARDIDKLLQQQFETEQITPNELTGDLEFLRRVSLDLIGRIPTLEEIEDFKQDPDRSKRIDELIGSRDFTRFVSEAWTTWLIGYTSAFGTDRATFRVWLQDQLDRNQPFDKMVTKILTAEGSVAINGPTNFLARHFEQPIIAVSRSFLGVRLECAQCHDHPYDRWTQDDYDMMGRFFEPMQRREANGVVTISDDLRDRGAGQRPRFLTGSTPRTNRYRQELALYLTNCKPFARNFANRIWYLLMGRGIVDPPDDFNQENPPVNPQLLELLASHARDTKFDVREMYRTICNTRAYQRKFAHSHNDDASVRYFAARTIKPMLPEQYIDSLLIGLDRPVNITMRRQLLQRLTQGNDLNEDYQRLWDYRETVQQLMQSMTFQFRGTTGQHNAAADVQELYLRILTRHPTGEEVKMCRGQRPADIMFALALSNEFCFNH